MIPDTEPLRQTKPMIRMIGLAGLFVVVIGFIYYLLTEQPFVIIPFALGVAATSALNVYKLRLLENSVQKVLSMDDPGKGRNMIRFQYLLRFLFTGAVLVAIGLIDNYTTAPPFFSPDRLYIPVWATLFPNAPDNLLTAPFISLWGALAGLFTLQLSVFLTKPSKLEKGDTKFVEYENNEEKTKGESDNADNDS